MLDNTCICMYIILIVLDILLMPQILRNMYRNTSVPYINVFRYNINRILTNIMPLLTNIKLKKNITFWARIFWTKVGKFSIDPLEPIYNKPAVVYLQGYSIRITFIFLVVKTHSVWSIALGLPLSKSTIK